VQITKRIGKADVVLAELGQGDCLGEMAILDGRPRSASAVVTEDADLVVVDRTTWEQLVREHGEIAVRIMRKLSERLREANRVIESFLTENGSLSALELLRGLAGAELATGYRPLPPETTPNAIAARAGLSLHEAGRVWDRLRSSGVIDDSGGEVKLAPDRVIEDYLQYLNLKKSYDPLTVHELSEITGLAEEEVHRLVRRVLDSRLQGGERGGGLADSYQQFLALKKRFEYLDRP
jgi:CRP-like cAMP-binding protein